MNRFLYTVLLYIALPFIPLKLFWRSLKQPDYRQHWAERFGFYAAIKNSTRTTSADTVKPVICLHCVSVGETRAAAPLIKALQAQYPNHQMLLTHATPTGRDTSTQLFGDTVQRVYLPYDVPFAVAGFLQHFKPAIVLLMETELWFNLIAACKQRNIPILLINARLSEKSARGYAKLGHLVQAGLQHLSAIAAQTQADASRFMQLGATQVRTLGNLKFDVALPNDVQAQGQQLRALFGAHRFIFIAASTRDGEEALILDAVGKVNIAGLLTAIVPRHPQRFDEVEVLFKARQLNYQRRTLLTSAVDETTHYILGDSMGELFTYYAASDVAFVGGSLLPFGGQNLIEPCALGKPVLIGPHTFNFELITQEATQCGAVLRVENVDAISIALSQLANNADQRQAMQQAGLSFVREKAGATAGTINLIGDYL